MSDQIDLPRIPSKECFQAVDSLNFIHIKNFPYFDRRLLVPYLIYWFKPPTDDSSKKYKEIYSQIEPIIREFPDALLVQLCEDLDYNRLESDARKDFQKCPGQLTRTDSMLIAPILQNYPTIWCNSFLEVFEADNVEYQMRLVLCELISINSINSAGLVHSYLLDNLTFVDHCIDLIYFAIQKMPRLFKLYEIVEILLKINNGLTIICRLVTICPSTCYEICSKLIEKSDPIDENNFNSTNRFDVISKLCQINPLESAVIRSQALQKRRMPNLIIKITMDRNDISDAIALLTGIFYGDDEQTRVWFSQFIKRKNLDTSEQNYFLKFREMLLEHFKYLTKKIYEMNDPGTNINGDKELIITEAFIMVKLYCALRGMAMMKLNENEVQAIKQLIICKSSLFNDRFISICLCMILVYPQMIPNQEIQIVEWIKWLLSKIYCRDKANTTESYGEMLLLIATFFYSNQLAQIGELVSSTLGIKHSITRTNDLILIKHIFIQNIFPIESVASLAIKVPVTNKLNDLNTGTLPIHCIYQLLKSRSFTKFNIPIKDWIFNQLFNSIAPIHRILPTLIEEFVNSTLIPNVQSNYTTNIPIAEEDLEKIFNYLVYSVDNSTNIDNNRPPCLLTSQLLFLYYILLYEDVYLKNIQNPNRPMMKYSNKFMSKLPIYYLIQSAIASPKDYGILRPPLMRLIAANYPHICLAKDWLSSSNEFTNSSSVFKSSHMESVINRLNILENSLIINNQLQIKEVYQYLNVLSKLETKYLWTFADKFIKLLPLAMNLETPKQIKTLMKDIWFRLNRIHPTEIWVMTVNEFNLDQNEKYNWNSLVYDPTGSLSCCISVFPTPELMEIIMHILNALLLVSKNEYYRADVKQKKYFKLDPKIANDLNNCAALQILLEICALKNKTGKTIDKTTNQELPYLLSEGREVQGLICSHLHQSFIADRDLAKLIMQQTYDIELIPVTINRIPSLHIFRDYVPDLLSSGKINPKVKKF